jgi:hypothetical protein
MIKIFVQLVSVLADRLGVNTRKELNTSIPFLFFVCIVGWIAAPPVTAQVGLSHVHPNLARGSGNGKTTETYGLDGVNLFNGNLNLSIPLGINYPVGASFSYAFDLVYNSNIWDIDQATSGVTAMPTKNSNAGSGWDMSFGRLIPPYVSGAQLGRWVYVSPDGALHPFYSIICTPAMALTYEWLRSPQARGSLRRRTEHRACFN